MGCFKANGVISRETAHLKIKNAVYENLQYTIREQHYFLLHRLQVEFYLLLGISR
ncbi:MAG: hypothetical protein H6Q59_2355 [Firmicutes bacterium]|nr:hypothetical protein [Bacillota bacterium]